MRRGEVYYADLNPTLGSETKKKRPVLVISNDINNKHSDTIMIVPLTSNITKVFPFEVLLLANNTGLQKDSKAQCHQIRTISKIRFSKSACGFVDDANMYLVERALELHMDL